MSQIDAIAAMALLGFILLCGAIALEGAAKVMSITESKKGCGTILFILGAIVLVAGILITANVCKFLDSL